MTDFTRPTMGRFRMALFLSLLASICFLQQVHAQNRRGSVKLNGDSNNKLIFDTDGTNYTFQGEQWTVEGWVFSYGNNPNNDFNFFRLISGNATLSFHYEGDDALANGNPWRLETHDTSENGKSGNKKWAFDYLSSFSAPNFFQKWHHVAIAVNRNNIKIYIDGELAVDESIEMNGYGAPKRLWYKQGNNGEMFFGGKSAVDGNHDKMYLAEARIWSTNLSGSEIAQYYNEEVNENHPQWEETARYYHGHYANGSGGSRTFPHVGDKNGEDATVNDGDVIMEQTYYPYLSPPQLSASQIGLTAEDCSDDQIITLSWNDLTSSSNTYFAGAGKTTYAVGYEVKRDGAIIYEGIGTSTTESRSYGDISTYSIRTYWLYPNGTKYYSNNSISDVGSVKASFAAPSLSATTDQCEVKINVSWTRNGDVPPNWTL